MQRTTAIAIPVANRVASVDILRGLVMIIMALDHVRDYFHADAFLYDPLDLGKTNGLVFFTRWITHFCAPVFMLLAGTSAFFVGQRKSKPELSAFLLKRGLWLIFLEFVVANFGWNFSISFPTFLFIVIWALGVSMIVLALLVHLPFRWILFTGIVLVAAHNLLDNFHVTGNTLPAFGWSLLHEPGFFTWGDKMFFVGYPILPWIGIMCLGYCLGSLYTVQIQPAQRKKLLLLTGGSAIALFIMLRLLNTYGDPSPWTHQRTTFLTLLSFVNTSKYPPSLLYILMTLGPALLFLALTENVRGRVAGVISVYGRVPLFYYLIHIYLIHLLAMIASELFTGVDWKHWILDQPLWFNDSLRGNGYSIGVVYAVWAGIVVALYPLCRWYDRYKQSHKHHWWLSYL